MPRVLIVGEQSYKSAFDTNIWSISCIPWEVTDETLLRSEIEFADLICLTGGEDIYPVMYGASPVLGSDPHQYNMDRDNYEKRIYIIAKHQDKPFVGICRGAQFLNVMNGGYMVQDMDGHHGSHMAFSYTDPSYGISVSSDHHQMMVPNYERAEVLLIAGESHGINPPEMIFKLEETDQGYTDPEVILYRKTKDLCHQPHPEWVDKGSPYWNYFNYTVNKLMEL